ncbi:hypothetical protein GCM10009555_059650 [Acrocarpospora macrocephala]|uniref:Serine-threonine protein kinase n=1 Tax=Acrocarpospora macrocephala TaxID=150177 RepID=A0A5M3WT56_9ACTN|nr:hypothetical protein [Acrocarpospora macrocephala]GES11810.1 hypothetical protein Amac_054070 [Acrocarpospora macrocephala]
MRFPYAKVQFRSTGEPHDPAERQRALDLVRAPGVTDILVLSHGWNNDMAAAEALYQDLAASLDSVRRPGGMNLAVIGVLWPSIRWAEPGQLAGGGLGVDDGAAQLRREIQETVPDPELAAALDALVGDLDSAAAQARFLGLLRGSLPAVAPGDEEPPPSLLTVGDAGTAFSLAGEPLPLALLPEAPGGAGSIGGGLASFSDVFRAGRLLLNTTTYFTMKERAGTVGSTGVARLLNDLATVAPNVRRHLAGHSFGARLVTAAARRHAPLHSISLLQGAFSHYALSTDYDGDKDGFFQGVLSPGRLTGPMLITHTANDLAVGIAYAVISRLARQNASAVGGPDDTYGGLGRNGALRTPQVTAPPDSLLDADATYAFRPGKVYNLQSDTFIKSHGTVTGREVANAMIQAMTVR